MMVHRRPIKWPYIALYLILIYFLFERIVVLKHSSRNILIGLRTKAIETRRVKLLQTVVHFEMILL